MMIEEKLYVDDVLHSVQIYPDASLEEDTKDTFIPSKMDEGYYIFFLPFGQSMRVTSDSKMVITRKSYN